jgi:electron transfer flavoprotein alpha subunit
MGFGPVGKYKAIVTSNFPTLANPSGKIYEEEFETIAITHDAGTTGQTTSIEIQDDVQQRVIPIYQKNKNATLTIESTHPTPATIHNLTWEGVYTPPYYTRV